MKKIDHVRKTVYIIVGILTIISLVFTIFKKVGLCAEVSPSGVFDGVPFIFGYGYNDNYTGLQSSTILQNVDDAISRLGSDFVPGSTVVVKFMSFSASKPRVIVLFVDNSQTISIPSSDTNFNGYDVNVPYYATYLYYNGVFQSGGLESSRTNIDTRLVSSPSGGYVYDSSSTIYYSLVYAYNWENWCFTDTTIPVFAPIGYDPDSDPGFSSHTKGGVLANYIDSHLLLEDSSDLPEVDVTPPSDPTTNNLLQKILNGLGVLNGSIQGGVLTIGDYIGQGFENILNWLTEPFDSDQFNSELNQIALINDFSNLKTQVENCGIFNWSDVTPAQSLSFTFDVGGAVLPHTSCVIDFSWYTGTVKNICVAVICTFLVLGLLVTIINQLPNIIGGKSGDKGGGSDS